MGRLTFGIAGMVWALAGLVVTPGAHAASKSLSGFIGAAAGGAGGRFLEPSDVAVYGGDRRDPSDDRIFVVEALATGNNRVQRLDRHGNFELMWGRDVVRSGAPGDRGTGYEVCRRSVSGAAGCKAAPAGAGRGELDTPTAVAVDQSTGHVYVMDHGNRRVQVFDLDGGFVRAWRHGFAGSGNGSIAVSPTPPRHVFIGDAGRRRVLEFEPEGSFVRAWRAGSRARAWPSHLAVDRDEVLYASEGVDDADVLRLDVGTARPAEARVSRLRAGEELSGGWTMGLEVDPRSGNLLVARNPFGPMVVDIVSRPGAGVARSGVPAHETVDDLPYVESVNGVGVGFDGSVYVPKSATLSSYDPGSGFERCEWRGRTRPCHGLMVLAPEGSPAVAFDRVVRTGDSTALLEGRVEPHGALRYLFQVSKNGRVWRDVGDARYVSGARARRVSVRARSLRPASLYRARILLTTRDPQGERSVASNIAFFTTATPEVIATERPAATFAPLVHLHSDEKAFPIAASRFLERATVKWKDGDCLVLLDVATGRIASRKTLGAPRTEVARLGRRGRPYRRRALDRSCSRRVGRPYSATELTRPFDRGPRAPGLPAKSGFYLDLLSDSLDGDPRFERRGPQRVLAGVPAYYERDSVTVEGRRGVRLTYWLLYGRSDAPRARGGSAGYHEGGWERVEVLLRPARGRGRWLPRVVRFHVAARRLEVPWREIARHGTHPVAFAARGTHHPYPWSGRYEPRVSLAGRRVRLRDDAKSCSRCPQWRTWESLRSARAQPWYGFGGGWGLSFIGDDTSGPLGPR
ncbi:MAG TPA: NHL repeat-containing protein [Thermoleophilaceae bacterium]|nr:NHL repeat-containing protein [Thermoleophilaceae bacterium]